MSRWTPPEADELTPAVVREARRAQLFDDLAQKREARRRAASMRQAVLMGVLAGVLGSAALHVFA